MKSLCCHLYKLAAYQFQSVHSLLVSEHMTVHLARMARGTLRQYMDARARIRQIRLLSHEDDEVAYYARQRFADEEFDDDLDDVGKEVMKAVREARLKRAREEIKRPHRQTPAFKKGTKGFRKGRGKKKPRGGPSGGRQPSGKTQT